MSATLLSRFRIEGLLGRGGMGEVHRAFDTLLGRPVALKRVRHDRQTDPTAVGRFLREAQAVAHLRHRNIVTIYDLGDEGGVMYIVMELLDGASMRSRVGDGTVAPWQRMNWIRAVASGLVAAHAAGFIHRDIKPDNVFLCRDGSVKILDFGLARRIGLRPLAETADAGAPNPAASFWSHPGAIAGTPAYMAPEQARGAAVDGRSDQYAWGVLAYEVVHGCQFSPALREALLPPGFPPALWNILRRAVDEVPDERFPSMQYVLSALDSLFGMEGPTPMSATASIHASPTTRDLDPSMNRTAPVSTSRSTVFRIGVVAAATVGIATVLMTIVGLVLWPGRTSVDRRGAPAVSGSVEPSSSPPDAASTARPSGEIPTPPPPSSSGRALAGTTSAPASAPPSPKPAARARYGAGELSERTLRLALWSDCPRCDGQRWQSSVAAARSAFATCFASTVYKPPFHDDATFRIGVSAAGKYGAVEQTRPTPAHAELIACIARAMRSVPLVKSGGGPGFLEFEFATVGCERTKENVCAER